MTLGFIEFTVVINEICILIENIGMNMLSYFWIKDKGTKMVHPLNSWIVNMSEVITPNDLHS